MESWKYFSNMEVAMRLNGKCIICGSDEDFHIIDDNENGTIFKEKETPFCKDCATKLAIKILHGIDF